ncbi:hypothetical protein K1719_000016 [Acacia pycnantha]|nr:hypothetical protein K1719_000016 [Acacia pycnantha]
MKQAFNSSKLGIGTISPTWPHLLNLGQALMLQACDSGITQRRCKDNFSGNMQSVIFCNSLRLYGNHSAL